MPIRFSMTQLAALLWLLLMATALYARPHLPVDETRYLAVAWEMWLRGDFLVPHLNGETYSHKPPLLFWLMHAGWSIFGVNDWWPRLIAPGFGLGCLFLVRRLSRELWPTDARTADLVPLVLAGCAFWALFVTLTMFDMMLAFFALMGVLGAVIAAKGRAFAGFLCMAVAIGLGVLTKGPAILLHILPVALTAPLWAPRLEGVGPELPIAKSRWYLGVVLSVVAGAAMALVWAVPAGMAGGEDYQQAIFWGQAAGRMVESFAHQRPFWWYSAILPALVLPWFLWPTIWKSLRALGGDLKRDGGSLLCLIWMAVAFVTFSLISGKQLHYLLPEFPALALVAARSLSLHGDQTKTSRLNAVPVAVLFVLLGVVLMLLPLGLLPFRLPVWAPDVVGNWGGLIVLAALLSVFLAKNRLEMQMTGLVLLPVSLVVALHLALSPVLAARYDLAPVARYLKTFEDQGLPLANFGKYHGQYHFLGRLTRPMAVIGLWVGDVETFLEANPTGRIVTYYEKGRVPDRAEPLAVYHFRQHSLVIWDAKTMLAHPGIGNRT